MKPTILCILDGFGLAPPSKANAVSLAKMPVFNTLWQKYPHTQLQASGKYVGLSLGQSGNSEAGHINIGAGRIAEQDSVRINKSIADGTFFKNPAFLGVIKHVRKNKSNVHLMGLLCNNQSPHADPEHLQALLEFLRSKGLEQIFLHLFTDGRDSPPRVAIKLLKKLKASFKNGEIVATVTGRFYAMDRKKKWDRTKAAYEAMVLGKGYKVNNSEEAILHAYKHNETDEFIPPSVIYYQGKPGGIINNDDALIFFNLRSDRARQISKPFVQQNFESKSGFKRFKRKKILKNLYFMALTDFGPDLDLIMTAYPSIDLMGTLPMILGGRAQLYIAETEKYAHVTYFFNGGYAIPVSGEEWIKIPSVDVPRYDSRPAMSARPITDYLLKALKKSEYEFITVNFANPDMLGHTGNISAAIEGLEVVDECLGKIYEMVKAKNGNLIITSDHGNCDCMLNLKTGEMITEHTKNPVPFILASEEFKKKKLTKGYLGNVAPTILNVMGIKKPRQMKEGSLILKHKT